MIIENRLARAADRGIPRRGDCENFRSVAVHEDDRGVSKAAT